MGKSKELVAGIEKLKAPMTFTTETISKGIDEETGQEKFLKQMKLPPEEEGAKEQCTNSNNFHRHHKELSKVITEIKAEIGELKFFKRMQMSRYPEAYWCRVGKYIKRLIAQENKIKEEQRKLEVLKKERVNIHYH